MAIYPLLFIDGFEAFKELTNCLGSPEKEDASGAECEMKQ